MWWRMQPSRSLTSWTRHLGSRWVPGLLLFPPFYRNCSPCHAVACAPRQEGGGRPQQAQQDEQSGEAEARKRRRDAWMHLLVTGEWSAGFRVSFLLHHGDRNWLPSQPGRRWWA